MLKELNQGKWSRPTDRSAVYLEIAPGQTLGHQSQPSLTITPKVEAVDGPKGTWYKGPQRYCSTIYPLISLKGCGELP